MKRPLQTDQEALPPWHADEGRAPDPAQHSHREMFATILRTAMDGFSIVDTKGRFLEVNETFCQITGYSRAELLRMAISDVECMETSEQVAVHIEKVLQKGRDRFQTRHRRKDGAILDVEISAHHLSQDGGLFCAFVRDISERLRVEEALRASRDWLAREVRDRATENALLRTAIEQLPVSVVMADLQGRIEFINPAFTHITGYSLEEALGANTRILKSGLQEPAFYHQMWRTILSGGAWRGEVVNRRRDGALYTQELVIAPVRDTEGRVSRFVGIGHDVTERKRGEKRLADAVAFGANLLQAVPVAILTYRLSGECVSCNEVSGAMVGAPVEELKKQNFRALESWKKSGLLDLAEQAIATGRLQTADIHIVTTFGKERWCAARATVFRADDETLLLLVLADLTERKLAEARQAKTEEQLRQSQKLEAIGRLAGGVAHDFNNLLTVITGYGEIMRHQIPEGDPAQPRLNEMMKAAERAAGLTRQLLAFSRKQVMQPKVLDLNIVVRELKKMLDRVVGEDVGIDVRTASDLGTVKMDPAQIEQVIMNLVVNARDAMPDGGHLVIETANVDLDQAYAMSHPPTTPGRFVMLAVSDTGIGMDAETRRHIFEPFFTTKGPGEGTGLGLATVYGIVKQSGGYVWVYSEVGRGTAFKVYLPRLDEARAEEQRASAGAVVPRGHETVLVVEDMDGVREMIRETLEGQGYTVLVASNGEEALVLVRERQDPIHLLLTDVVMPKLGGCDLARQVSVLRPRTHVLFMSGYPHGVISRHGGLDEGVAILEKPFSPARLARAVRKALDGTESP